MKHAIRGYTLVEMVVVAGLVGLLSVGIVSVFISTIQGSKRAKIQALVKVQGDQAMSTMERTIRNAIRLPTCVSSPDDSSVSFQIKQDDGTLRLMTYSFAKGSLLVDGVPMITGSGSSGGVSVTAGMFTCSPGTQMDTGTVNVSMTLRAVGDATTTTDQSFQTTIAIRSMP